MGVIEKIRSIPTVLKCILFVWLVWGTYFLGQKAIADKISEETIERANKLKSVFEQKIKLGFEVSEARSLADQETPPVRGLVGGWFGFEHLWALAFFVALLSYWILMGFKKKD